MKKWVIFGAIISPSLLYGINWLYGGIVDISIMLFILFAFCGGGIAFFLNLPPVGNSIDHKQEDDIFEGPEGLELMQRLIMVNSQLSCSPVEGVDYFIGGDNQSVMYFIFIKKVGGDCIPTLHIEDLESGNYADWEFGADYKSINDTLLLKPRSIRSFECLPETMLESLENQTFRVYWGE